VPGGTAPATVLVVDDEPELADLYTDYLQADHEVLAAYGGDEALEYLDERADDVDVTLLDRRMPDVTGDEVLAHILEEGYECRVAMITAVNPGFDIIDMGCDEYLVKPVGRDELLGTVRRLLNLAEYSEKHQELTSKKLKRNVLRVERSRAELIESERFQQLEAEIRELEAELEDIGEDLDLADVQRQI